MTPGEITSAFSQAAGVSPATLSYAICTLIAVLAFLWGAWIIRSNIKTLKERDATLSVGHVISILVRVLIVITIIIFIVGK